MPQLTGHARQRARSTPWPVRVLLLVAVATTGAYTVSVLPGVRAGQSDVWEIWVANAVWLLATVISLIRAVRVAEDRGAWWALTLALASSTIGSVYFAVAFSGMPASDLPWVSLADLFWLAYYPLAYVAVVLMVRAKVKNFTTSTWLDGLVSGLAAAAFVATIAFDGLALASGQSTLTLMVAMAYPIADVLLVLLVIGFLAVTGWRPGRAWLLLGSGLLIQALADAVYLFQAADYTYVEATWLDCLWVIAALLTAAAAWGSSAKQTTVVSDWRTLATPIVSVSIATAVLALQALTGDRQVAVSLAVGTILVATLRAGFALHEVRALADSRREALTDELTGLPNRRRLLSALNLRMREGESFAVLLLDLDGFKEINDTLGHGTGDLLLTQVAQRLEESRRSNDILCRLGGDEFAMIAAGPLDPAGASMAARRVAAALSESFQLGAVTVTVEGSVGVAMFPDHGASASDLLSRADVAMYQAKRDRSEHAIYDPARNDHSVDRLRVVAEVREGLARGELVVHYQPQVELRTGSLIGLEALSRWQHPERGLLGPDAFLPAVEHTSVMRPFTEELLRTVLRQMDEWRGGPVDVPVSVNVAAPNLVDRTFSATVARLLAEHGVRPDQLVIEVTENAVLADAERALCVLHELRDLGVGLSIDDFGTGLSSLQRLRMLPVDELKIDKSFVAGLPDDIRDTAVVEASVTLARRMGLSVIAEGVETEDVRQILLGLGCARAQGFYFAKALSPESLEAWVAALSPPAQHRIPDARRPSTLETPAADLAGG